MNNSALPQQPSKRQRVLRPLTNQLPNTQEVSSPHLQHLPGRATPSTCRAATSPQIDVLKRSDAGLSLWFGPTTFTLLSWPAIPLPQLYPTTPTLPLPLPQPLVPPPAQA